MNAYRTILIILIFAMGLSACDEKAPQLKVGTAPPAYQLVNLKDKTVQFPVDYQGKPVVIRFWADWCPYCETEMTAIEKVFQEKGEEFTCLAINVSQSKEVAQDFIQKLGITYPILLDEDGSIARTYGVTGLPTSFFIDKEGKIKGKILGEMDENHFRKQLSNIL